MHTADLMAYLSACCALDGLVRPWIWDCSCDTDGTQKYISSFSHFKQNSLLKVETGQKKRHDSTNISLVFLSVRAAAE